jgi:predicted acetyltransferase
MIVKKGDELRMLTIEKVPKSQAGVLQNLYSLYLHDLSAYTPSLDIREDGAFHFEELPLFWKVEGLSPYFIKVDGELTGFFLLLEQPALQQEADYCINDFFILNKYRGQGIASKTVKDIFSNRKGTYMIIELADNKPAISFWKHIYESLHISFQEKKIEIDGEPTLVQTFNV